jgi:hypothetical protein
MDELQRAVLATISQHRGPQSRIARAELSQAVKASDRRVRKAIEFLRSNDERGCFIVADFPSGGQPGYFMARTAQEALEYMRPDFQRVDTMRSRLNAQKQLLSANLSPQMELL